MLSVVARLDELLLFSWPHAQRGSAEHIRAAVRIGERRARLLGLDAQVAAKLELAGAVVAVAAPSELTKLSDEELVERMRRATEFLLRSRERNQLPEPAPPLSAEEQDEAAYADVLAQRNGRTHELSGVTVTTRRGKARKAR